MTLDISRKNLPYEHRLAYSLHSQPYEEARFAAQIDGVATADIIRAAVGGYLARIPGLIELGASSPSRDDMDEWLGQQNEAVLKHTVEPLIGISYRTCSRFPLADTFALTTLVRGRMKQFHPEVVELMDQYSERRRVVVDDVLIDELQRQCPEAHQLTEEHISLLKGQAVFLNNIETRYLDWSKINLAQEKQMGFYVTDAVLEYASERQQDPAYVRERTRLIEGLEKLLPPLAR